jgi:niacin transporter
MLNIQKITLTGLLIAIGVLIPMIMPKISLPPASFTLASHVPVMIAMFISPAVAICVALGTSFGFFLSGLPIIITLRAVSHVIFAFAGAAYLQKFYRNIQYSEHIFPNWRFQLFNICIGVIHAAAESFVVMAFYFGQSTPITPNIYHYIFILIGAGGFLHSLIDFNIAYFLAIKLKVLMPHSLLLNLKKDS